VIIVTIGTASPGTISSRLPNWWKTFGPDVRALMKEEGVPWL